MVKKPQKLYFLSPLLGILLAFLLFSVKKLLQVVKLKQSLPELSEDNMQGGGEDGIPV